MSSIVLNNITYGYGQAGGMLFDKLNLNIDTGWRLGLIGRNGRGKTTMLRLINGTLRPLKGSVYSDIRTFYFPCVTENTGRAVMSVIKEAIAPFEQWETEMENLLKTGDEKSLSAYGDILEKYQKADGYLIGSLIEKEINEIGLDSGLLNRAFNELSGGEQTKTLLVSLFLKKNSFPLIDEPTNHLDIEGRIQMADYLSTKNGFIVVSHDRYFLDKCIDHVLSINKNDVTITRGNYSAWKYNFDIAEKFEYRKKENIKKEVKSLEFAAKKRRSWSVKKEKEKKGASDKGFIGHRAAKSMKRALNIERRISGKLEEKKELLKNYEKERELKFNKVKSSGDIILSAENISVNYNGRDVISNFSFTVRRGDRIAIIGKNGCGKTSILNIITKEISVNRGNVFFPPHYSYFYMRQNPVWGNGLLRDRLKQEKIDETVFRNIMAAFGLEGDIFERPLETFSRGENKKAEFAKSFVKSYDVIIWDEPLNFLDIMSREQIENTVLKYEPTLIFTEHDLRFVENIATEIIEL